MPLISVVMPVYNGEKYLPEGIESILNQTFKDFEFIIINDGSLDTTSDIVNKYVKKDPRIIFIDRKVNKKLPFTLNEGIDISQGYYIARMDADDIAHPDRFKMQVNYLNKNPDVMVLGTAYTVFDSQGEKKVISRNYPTIYMGFKFMTNTYLCHPSVVFRKEIIKTIGSYNEVGAEDYDFFSRICHEYRCENLPESYLHYREHEGNMSLINNEKIQNNVYEVSKNNFNYFFDDMEFFQKFYNIHANFKGNLLYFPKYISMSIAILNRILNKYKISFFSKDFFKFVLNIKKNMKIF